MRAFSRLLNWGPRLRAMMSGEHAAIDPSNPDYQAFALERYSPDQQREIVKLIARQPVISRSDIADALGRAQRKARLSGQLTGAATGLAFVALFAMGLIVARRQPVVPTVADPPPTASATADAVSDSGHWSPGGLDEADREFFADLQAGQSATRSATPRPRQQPAPAALPPTTPAPAVMVAAAQPVAPRVPQPAAPGHTAVIQLGAFADAAVARARWQSMSTEFPSLRPLTETVAPIARGGHTLYRLQASGADAASACPVLTGAGASCVVIASAAAPAPPAAATPVKQPVAVHRETVIQLGAFADAAVAKARWRALSMKFPSLRPLTQTVSAVARGGHTIYRLRARGTDAASACSALAGAGANCFVATDAS